MKSYVNTIKDIIKLENTENYSQKQKRTVLFKRFFYLKIKMKMVVYTNNELPVDLSCMFHIKKRSECSYEENKIIKYSNANINLDVMNYIEKNIFTLMKMECSFKTRN